jgi:anti-sigma factor RsiW
MNHAQALHHLDELFDGALPPALAADVDRHVQACSHCQAALARRAALSRSLSGQPVKPPSDILVQAVMRRIAAGDRPASAPVLDRWLMPSLAAGLAAAVLVIGIGVTGVRREPDAAAGEPVARIEPEGEESLAGIEPARSEDAEQAILVAMEE